jgi:thiamine monophosphate synthase
MPTSVSEWTSVLLGSVIVGALAGTFTRRTATALLGIAVLQILAAPIMYYAPPLIGHGPIEEYNAWALLGIPMVAIRSAIWSSVVAFTIL